ncbi:hypothetical protein Tco_0460881 [Tanacetum coccineum]
MSIQDYMEDLKQLDLGEMKKEKELLQQEQAAYVRTSQRFNFIDDDDDDEMWEDILLIIPTKRTELLTKFFPPIPPFMTNNEDKNVKKTTNASVILEDFNPPLYELPFYKEVPGLRALLSFSFENEEKVFNPGIITSKRVHTFLLPELSHRGPKAFKVIKIFESPMEIFSCSYGEDIRVLDVPCLHFYPP